jgi:ankyrin repeat protein
MIIKIVIINNFFYVVVYFEELVMKGNWDDVITNYEEDEFYHTLKIKGRGTALHVAISNGVKDAVKKLVDAILKHHHDESSAIIPLPLKMEDERGGTPLHIAAYRGFNGMCECIIGQKGERKNLIEEENDDGETPLFWAVQGHRKKTFVYLYQFAQEDVNIVMDKNDTTILHVAIRREMFG